MTIFITARQPYVLRFSYPHPAAERYDNDGREFGQNGAGSNEICAKEPDEFLE